jgi:hypothetical protein
MALRCVGWLIGLHNVLELFIAVLLDQSGFDEEALY